MQPFETILLILFQLTLRWYGPKYGMAQSQLLLDKQKIPQSTNHFKHFDEEKSRKLKEKKKTQIIIIKDDITITVYSNSILLKNTDHTGKSKSLLISKQNWYHLLFYQNIIESCFHKFDETVKK